MEHTQETKRRAMLLDSGNEFLRAAEFNNDKQPRFLVVWALGHKDVDIITLMEDGSVRYNGSWKYRPEGRSDANDHELQNALGKLKNETEGGRLFGVRTWNQRQSQSETHCCLSTNNSSFFRNRQLVDGEIRRRWQGVEASWTCQ